MPLMVANSIASKKGILEYAAAEKRRTGRHGFLAFIFVSCARVLEDKEAVIFVLNWVRTKWGTEAEIRIKGDFLLLKYMWL